MTNNVETIVRTHPFKPLYLPPGASWFNSAEWINAILKSHMQKAFALRKSDPKMEYEVRSFIWDELEKVRVKLKGSRVMYAIIPELTRALNAP